MKDRLQEADWTENILSPQPDWYSQNLPVVKITELDARGEVLSEEFARVSPKRQSIPDREAEVVTLDYEISDDGVHMRITGVEVEVLKAGGWKDPYSGKLYIVDFAGFTQDEKLKDKAWSYTF